jgi:hypothetical protein
MRRSGLRHGPDTGAQALPLRICVGCACFFAKKALPYAHWDGRLRVISNRREGKDFLPCLPEVVMKDLHLNSVHLEFPRREDFRRARDALLQSRGSHTIAVEARAGLLSGASHTMIEDAEAKPPPNADFWLMDQEGVYPLKVGVNTIGRLPDNDVVIQGPYVSRRHCAILVHSGTGCELYDIASKNGTYINGLKLSGPTHLSSGDEIRMCNRQVVFVSE